MSKILHAGEIGFGLLVEQDAGFINSEINKDILNENFEIKPNEPVLVNCILQKWGVKNKNGRIYPKDVLIPQVQAYQELVKTNSAVSESDHPDCVSASESMICTKDGWKQFKNISENEEILTLNIDTDKIEIQKIDEKIYTPYKGKMYKFSGKNIDLTVTANHRFLLEDRNYDRKYFYAKDIFDNVNNVFSGGKYRILKNGKWYGKNLEYFTLKGIPENSEYVSDLNIKSEDWFAFMGTYLGNGQYIKNKSGNYGVITIQKNIENAKMIEELYNRLPFKYTIIKKNGKYQYRIIDDRLYNYLYPLGNSFDKYIPIELKIASEKLLNVLFEWYVIGCGKKIKISEKSDIESISCNSKTLTDDLLEILIKTNKNGKITKKSKTSKFTGDKIKYILHISKTEYILLNKNTINVEEIDFDENIACVRVPNGNFLIKVNGKSHWTGNSSIISLQNISHMITKMWWGKGEQENILYGQLKLIVSPGYIKYGIVSVVGDKIVLYLQNKIKLGISSRGIGTLKEIQGENVVQNDFELIGFDLVSSPSTPGAFLFPANDNISFNENYVNKNGVIINENDKTIITILDNFIKIK